MKAIEPIGMQDIQRSKNEKAPRHLGITLEGDDGRSNRPLLIELGVAEDSPKKFVVLEFPVSMKNPGEILWHLDGPQAELVVRLAGPASAPKIYDLSAVPLGGWIATMFSIFAGCPAAVAILTNHGQIHVAMHEGN